MPLPSVRDLDFDGQRALVRVDFDVPLTPARGVADVHKLRAALPTLKLVLEKGARLVLAAHLGQPGGKTDPALSLEPVAVWLAEALGRDVYLTDETAGDGARKVVSDLRPGEIALLENLRSVPGEEANDDALARGLASYADVYINDCFATAHLAHASTVALPRLVGRKAAGLAFEAEVQQLGRLQAGAEILRPFIAVVGGLRVAEKLRAMEGLLPHVNAIYVGGALASTILRARGIAMGRSLVEGDRLVMARSFLRKAEERDVPIILPRDLIAGAGTGADSGRVISASGVPDELAVLDIGPESARSLTEGVQRARTVFWHGAMGASESEPFAAGTFAVARAVANVSASFGGFTVASGACALHALRRTSLLDRVSHISMGGAATLEFLAGTRLPGLEALETRKDTQGKS